MVEKIVYCDRCGKDVSKSVNYLCGKYLDSYGFHIEMRKKRKFSLKKYKGHPDHYWEEADLCQDCYDSLRDWMKEGKKKDGSNKKDG